MAPTLERAVESLKRKVFLREKSMLHRLRNLKGSDGDKQIFFVAGVHRSGTNMLMRVLERSWDTDVYLESDPRVFRDFIMRDSATVRRVIEESPARRVVVKALHEADNLTELLQAFGPAKLFWIYRSYDDVVNSSLKHWPGWRNQLEDIIADPTSASWRGRGMTPETLALIKSHHHGELSDASAQALFWYYRNQLYYDQELAGDPRVLILKYEDLVQDPEPNVRDIAEFAAISANDEMIGLPSTSSIRKNPTPDIEPKVRDLCDAMTARLDQSWQDFRARFRAKTEVAA